MIPANELRIGNLVLINDKPIQLDLKMFHAVLMGFPGYEPAQIEITEQWLYKLGFDLDTAFNGDGDEFEYYFIKKPNGDNLYLTLGYQPEDCSFPIVDYEIKYIHQIQNFFFALTGEELKIKND